MLSRRRWIGRAGQRRCAARRGGLPHRGRDSPGHRRSDLEDHRHLRRPGRPVLREPDHLAGYPPVTSPITSPVTSTLEIGHATASGKRASVTVTCQTGGMACTVTLTLSTISGHGHKRHRIKLGMKTTTVPAGQRARSTVRLNARGRALLKRSHSLEATLTIKVAHGGKKTSRSQTLTFKGTK